MNSISWLIYLSSVLPNLQVTASIISFFLAFAVVVGWILSFAMDRAYDEKVYYKIWPEGRKVMPWLTALLFFLISIAILSPDKNTVLAIATSEFTANYLQQSGTGTELSGIVTDTLKLLHQQISGAVK